MVILFTDLPALILPESLPAMAHQSLSPFHNVCTVDGEAVMSIYLINRQSDNEWNRTNAIDEKSS
jgi:hypothetical protein